MLPRDPTRYRAVDHGMPSYGRFRYLRRVYQCSRARGKTGPEILLEYAAKLLLPRTGYTTILKILLQRYRLSTKRDFLKTLKSGITLPQLLERRKLSTQMFFLESSSQSTWQAYAMRFHAKWPAILEQAEALCRHEFDVLGSGKRHWGNPIDWHYDPKSGYRWPKTFFAELYPLSKGPAPRDVKVPHELSRMQHLPTLGKAYRLTKHESYAQELVAQVQHWLDDNPCLIGVNWSTAMEVGLRIVNLLWGLAFIEDSPAMTPAFKQRVWATLWEHGQYLVRHLEFSIRPDGSLSNHNHYLSNLVGLVYLGILFPEFHVAGTWRRIGVQGLIEEMERQVLPDGVGYESSTSYHRLTLECFTSAALLCRLNGITLPETFWTRLEKMYAFTMYVTRPDGNMPQIGDADDGRVHILSDYGSWDPTDHRYMLSIGAALFHRTDMKARAGSFSEEAFWLLGVAGETVFDALPSTSPSLGSKAFPDAGFYVMRSGRTYLLACCNAVGTAGKGNHKHNDLLSFELSLQDTAFIVDPGAYIYTAAPAWRNRFRSTRSHNTVTIDGQEQNRFQPHTIFQLTPDAEPLVHRWCRTDEDDWLDAEHTGYGRFSCPVSHRRTFYLDKRTDRLRITDILRGAGEHTAEWYFHLDHGVEVVCRDNHVVLTGGNGRKLRLEMTSECPLIAVVENGWVSRSYGTKLPAKTLKFQGVFSERCRTVFELYCQ